MTNREFDIIQDPMWKNFYPVLLETAKTIPMRYEPIRNDELIITKFISERTHNEFLLIDGLKDGHGGGYFRFLCNLCPYTSELDLEKLLRKSSALGTSIYIDDIFFVSELVVKYEQPTIGGYPNTVWFEYVLKLFDVTITTLKREFNIY